MIWVLLAVVVVLLIDHRSSRCTSATVAEIEG